MIDPRSLPALPLLILLAAPSHALRDGPEGCEPEHRARGERFEQAIDSLALDRETRDAVLEVLDAAHSEQEALRAELRGAHEVMRELLAADDASPDVLMAQAEHLGTLRTEARKTRLRAWLEVRELLGAEQREQLRDAMRPGDREREPGRGRRGWGS
ncbi:MAG: periplasmic heavy metal sensor [Myxococcota bacterium]|nr:periplasmic heavy metal sensor [Myxococcota bacterium]